MAKRASRAAVGRALREVEILWRPPDPGTVRDNGRGQAAEVGTDEQNELPSNSTPARAKRKVSP